MSNVLRSGSKHLPLMLASCHLVPSGSLSSQQSCADGAKVLALRDIGAVSSTVRQSMLQCACGQFAGRACAPNLEPDLLPELLQQHHGPRDMHRTQDFLQADLRWVLPAPWRQTLLRIIAPCPRCPCLIFVGELWGVWCHIESFKAAHGGTHTRIDGFCLSIPCSCVLEQCPRGVFWPACACEDLASARTERLTKRHFHAQGCTLQ